LLVLLGQLHHLVELAAQRQELIIHSGSAKFDQTTRVFLIPVLKLTLCIFQGKQLTLTWVSVLAGDVGSAASPGWVGCSMPRINYSQWLCKAGRDACFDNFSAETHSVYVSRPTTYFDLGKRACWCFWASFITWLGWLLNAKNKLSTVAQQSLTGRRVFY
jgi:hypothetical protein